MTRWSYSTRRPAAGDRPARTRTDEARAGAGALRRAAVLTGLLGAPAALVFGASAAHAEDPRPATLYVATTGTNTTDCTARPYPCKTIQYAIERAEGGAFDQDAVTILVAGGRYLENDAIDASRLSSLTVKPAPGTGTVTVDGDGNGGVFFISIGSVTLDDLTLTGGMPDAVHNRGDVTLIGDTITGNTSPGIGAGVYNLGTAELDSDTITGNHAALRAAGVFNFGTATLYNDTITDNIGGGISNSGRMTVTGGTISGNSGVPNGGGVENYSSSPAGATLMITGVAISHNSATGFGGGLVNTGFATLTGSSVRDNSVPATGRGGGIGQAGDHAVTLLTSTTVEGNTPDDCDPSSICH